jgi:hypothetical protein
MGIFELPRISTRQDSIEPTILHHPPSQKIGRHIWRMGHRGRNVSAGRWCRFRLGSGNEA